MTGACFRNAQGIAVIGGAEGEPLTSKRRTIGSKSQFGKTKPVISDYSRLGTNTLLDLVRNFQDSKAAAELQRRRGGAFLTQQRF